MTVGESAMVGARSDRACGLTVLATIAMLFSFSGCGSLNYVTGKVSYKGKNLNLGSVTFVGADGKKAIASISQDGTYKLIEPPLGQVKVAVQVVPLPKIAPVAPAKDLPPPGKTTPVQPVTIPANYADHSKSSLTTELKTGSNIFDIDLK